jgi:hypothetical protein
MTDFKNGPMRTGLTVKECEFCDCWEKCKQVDLCVLGELPMDEAHPPPSDFNIQYHGTVTLLKPLTDACAEWVEENVAAEDWQWLGGALAVEPRYLPPLVEGLIEAGFTQQE